MWTEECASLLIEGELGIPLENVQKFSVKGNVLLHRKRRSVVELNLKEPQEYVRPECQQCADFSTELADISFGGVELMRWTIVV